MNNPNFTPVPQPSMTGPWLWVAASLLYFISPVDFVPDVPIVGQIDDVLIGLISTMNLVQAYLGQSNQALASIVRILKIILIIFSIIAISLIALVGVVVFKTFFS